MTNSKYWTCVLAALLSVLCEIQSSPIKYSNEVLVDPTANNSSCCLPHQNSSVCQNIDIALRKCRRNSTKYKLEAGIEHYLSNGTDVFTNIHDVALVSSNDSEVEVQCRPGAGLAFNGSTNIVISNVRFLYCGTLRDSTSRDFSSQKFSLLMFNVTLYFYQCTSVTLDRVAVVNSTNATGVVMYDTVGTNNISHSVFSGNLIQTNYSGVVGGGGFLVEFTYCKPGDNNCTSDDSLQSHMNSDSLYAFINCTFERNNCYGQKLPDRIGAFIFPSRESHTSLGRGGGLSLYFKSNATNNSITIRDCNFTKNNANYGSGFYFAFEDHAINNTVHVVSSRFLGNQHLRLYNRGGGIRASFHAHKAYTNATGNIVNISNCTFQGNSAFHGGGLSMSLALQDMSYVHQLTSINVEKSVFDQNAGKIGSAVEITLLPMFAYGRIGNLRLSNCTFTNNSGKVHIKKIPYSNALGAVYINEVFVFITDQTVFESNTDSAVVVSGTQISFQSCNATFINNTGINGGAIALLGASYMLLNENSTMTFEGNSATQYGGAIYNNYVVQTDMRFYIKCFIRYIANNFTDPSEWKARFRFKDNFASLLGKSIYSTSLYPCSWSFDSTQNTDKIFCWNKDYWDYSGQHCSDEISSGPSEFTNTHTHIQTYPGQIFQLKLEARDELEHNITSQTVYSAKICKDNSTAQVEPQFAYTADRYLAVTGEGNQTVTLELDTAGEQDWHIDIQLELMKCPPGMKMTNSTDPATSECACPQKNSYGGLIYCDKINYEVQIRRNYWIGNVNVSDASDGELFVGSCPYFYCMNSSDPDFVTLASTTKDLVPQICKKQNRRGILCGECIDGYAVAINSYEYTCVACNKSGTIKKDIAIYVVTAYVPIFVFFLFIIFFNIRLTTGPMNAFIVFAQVISSVNMFDIPVTLNKYPYIHKAYTFIYGISNLNFFSYLLDPFCVNENFSTLDVLSLDYCIAAFPLVMIGLITLVIRLKDRFNCDEFCCIGDSFILRVFKIKNKALLHTFVAFCLFSYTKFSQASTLMITTFLLTAENGSSVNELRVYLAGQYTFKDHVFLFKYGLPSICIFAVFVILPPLLLLGPLNWFNNRASKYRILRKLWPQDKVHIILDTFQGCFKPKMRFFAGVYFLFRLLAFISYAFLTDILHRYAFQQMLVLTVLALLALLQPYQSKILNHIDTSIFFVLALINSLSVLAISQYNASDQSYRAPRWISIVQFVLIFLPLLGMAFYIYFMWNIHCYQKLKNIVFRLFNYCYRDGNPEEEQPLITDRCVDEAVNDDTVLLERANEPNTFLYRPRPASISLRRSGSVSGNEEDGKALLADYGSQDTTSGIASLTS